MAHYKPKKQKVADDASTVTLYQDLTRAWFVGRDNPSDLAHHPIPMGAFISEQAAQKWADARFPGGSWSEQESKKPSDK